MTSPKPRPAVQTLSRYICARDVCKEADVFLDANESPFPGIEGGWSVSLNRYPDPDCTELKIALGAFCDCPPQRILVGNGSDEIISLATSAFVEAGDNAVTVQPGYSMWGIRAQAVGAKEIQVLMTPEFDLDANAVFGAIDSKTKIILLANPNAATGKIAEAKELRKLLEGFGGMVFVDEAYVEFSGNSVLPLVQEFDNLLVSRTLSKAWGLAALRIGYCIASESIVQAMRKIKLPYNVNSISQELAAQVVREGGSALNSRVAYVRRQRQRLVEGLTELGWTVFPGEANFVLARLPKNLEASTIQRTLYQEKSILVRDRSSLPFLDNCIRITVGTEEENERLLKSLAEVLNGGGRL